MPSTTAKARKYLKRDCMQPSEFRRVSHFGLRPGNQCGHEQVRAWAAKTCHVIEPEPCVAERAAGSIAATHDVVKIRSRERRRIEGGRTPGKRSFTGLDAH